MGLLTGALGSQRILNDIFEVCVEIMGLDLVVLNVVEADHSCPLGINLRSSTLFLLLALLIGILLWSLGISFAFDFNFIIAIRVLTLIGLAIFQLFLRLHYLIGVHRWESFIRIPL